jgi:hypothetical protein
MHPGRNRYAGSSTRTITCVRTYFGAIKTYRIPKRIHANAPHETGPYRVVDNVARGCNKGFVGTQGVVMESL